MADNLKFAGRVPTGGRESRTQPLDNRKYLDPAPSFILFGAPDSESRRFQDGISGFTASAGRTAIDRELDLTTDRVRRRVPGRRVPLRPTIARRYPTPTARSRNAPALAVTFARRTTSNGQGNRPGAQ